MYEEMKRLLMNRAGMENGIKELSDDEGNVLVQKKTNLERSYQ